MNDSIGARIKSLREKHNITSQDLADMIGCSRKTIQRYENDVYEPTYINLDRMSKAFNVSINYLIGKEQDGDLDYVKVHQFYKRYKSLFTNEILENEDYYWISLEIADDGTYIPGCYSCWAGFTEDSPPQEIREARRFIHSDVPAAIELCTQIKEPPIILNKISEIGLFYIFGGQAIASCSLCDKHMPEFVGPYLAGWDFV